MISRYDSKPNEPKILTRQALNRLADPIRIRQSINAHSDSESEHNSPSPSKYINKTHSKISPDKKLQPPIERGNLRLKTPPLKDNYGNDDNFFLTGADIPDRPSLRKISELNISPSQLSNPSRLSSKLVDAKKLDELAVVMEEEARLLRSVAKESRSQSQNISNTNVNIEKLTKMRHDIAHELQHNDKAYSVLNAKRKATGVGTKAAPNRPLYGRGGVPSTLNKQLPSKQAIAVKANKAMRTQGGPRTQGKSRNIVERNSRQPNGALGFEPRSMKTRIAAAKGSGYGYGSVNTRGRSVASAGYGANKSTRSSSVDRRGRDTETRNRNGIHSNRSGNSVDRRGRSSSTERKKTGGNSTFLTCGDSSDDNSTSSRRNRMNVVKKPSAIRRNVSKLGSDRQAKLPVILENMDSREERMRLNRLNAMNRVVSNKIENGHHFSARRDRKEGEGKAKANRKSQLPSVPSMRRESKSTPGLHYGENRKDKVKCDSEAAMKRGASVINVGKFNSNAAVPEPKPGIPKAKSAGGVSRNTKPLKPIDNKLGCEKYSVGANAAVGTKPPIIPRNTNSNGSSKSLRYDSMAEKKSELIDYLSKSTNLSNVTTNDTVDPYNSDCGDQGSAYSAGSKMKSVRPMEEINDSLEKALEKSLALVTNIPETKTTNSITNSTAKQSRNNNKASSGSQSNLTDDNMAMLLASAAKRISDKLNVVSQHTSSYSKLSGLDVPSANTNSSNNVGDKGGDISSSAHISPSKTVIDSNSGSESEKQSTPRSMKPIKTSPISSPLKTIPNVELENQVVIPVNQNFPDFPHSVDQPTATTEWDSSNKTIDIDMVALDKIVNKFHKNDEPTEFESAPEHSLELSPCDKVHVIEDTTEVDNETNINYLQSLMDSNEADTQYYTNLIKNNYVNSISKEMIPSSNL